MKIFNILLSVRQIFPKIKNQSLLEAIKIWWQRWDFTTKSFLSKKQTNSKMFCKIPLHSEVGCNFFLESNFGNRWNSANFSTCNIRTQMFRFKYSELDRQLSLYYLYFNNFLTKFFENFQSPRICLEFNFTQIRFYSKLLINYKLY